jgi:nucleoside-triphosphatase THEP1
VAHRVRYEEQQKAFCAANTRVGILKGLERWATELSDDQRICWITGIPGSGKSTIAATIARRLKQRDVLRAQYFISRNVPDTTDPKRLFPTIAQQLAESPAAARVIHEELTGSRARADALGKEQAEALLLQPIQEASGSSQTSVIVIDALDELESPGKDDVPPILFDIASQLPKNVKLIITSRPENSIVAALKPSYTVTLDPDDSRDEVADFISSKLKAIGKSRGWQEWPLTTQIRDLSAKADGLFHYAATAVGWIQQRVEKNGKAVKERVFDEVPQLGVGELEKLYDLILKTWLVGDTGEEHSADDPMRATRLKYFPCIIGCIVVRQRPLSIRHITSILNIPEKEFDIENFFQQMRSVLIPGTDSFTEDDIPQMHKSFRDYICSRHPPKEFQIYEHEAHMVTAKACLSVVVKTQDSGPAYHYACTQWWRHLELTYKEEPQRDSEITYMLKTLQDSSVRSAWYSEIDVLDAFIALAKVGWAGMKVSSCCLGIRLTEPFMIMKKFGVDDMHKPLDTILAQLKVCELNEAAMMY